MEKYDRAKNLLRSIFVSFFVLISILFHTKISSAEDSVIGFLSDKSLKQKIHIVIFLQAVCQF